MNTIARFILGGLFLSPICALISTVLFLTFSEAALMPRYLQLVFFITSYGSLVMATFASICGYSLMHLLPDEPQHYGRCIPTLFLLSCMVSMAGLNTVPVFIVALLCIAIPLAVLLRRVYPDPDMAKVASEEATSAALPKATASA